MSQRIKLWDLPTRVFHWSLVILIACAFITAQIGGNAMDWHGRIGLAILGLIVFRLVWGLIGSTHARFVNFFPTPASVRAYLRGQWKGIGHNPLGAFSVFGLLGIIALQVVTGLFNNDDIAFQGYLYSLINKGLSDSLHEAHKLASDLMLALIVLHLGAIMFYTHVKKEKLIKPMITGWKDLEPSQAKRAEPARGGSAVAFIAALAIALAAIYGASGMWISVPPATTSSTPAW